MTADLPGEGSNGRVAGIVLLGVLLCLQPVVPFPFLGAEGAQSVIRYVPFILVVGSVVAGCQTLRQLARQVQGIQILAWLTIISVALVAGSISGLNPWSSLARAVYYTVTGELCVALAFALPRTHRDVDLLLGCMVTIGIAVAGYTILESLGLATHYRDTVFARDNPLIARVNGPSDRAIGTVGNPIPLGTYLAGLVPLLMHVVFRDKQGWGRATIAAAALITVTIALYLTLSRTAWVAASVGAGVYLLLRFKRLLPVLLLTGLALGALVSVNPRMERSGIIDEYVVGAKENHRLNSYTVGLSLWGSRPLLGIGVGEYRHYAGTRLNHLPDNMIILILAERGLVGLVASCALVYAGIRSAIGRSAHAERAGLGVATSAAIASYVAAMVGWDVLAFPLTRFVFWMLVGLSLRWSTDPTRL